MKCEKCGCTLDDWDADRWCRDCADDHCQHCGKLIPISVEGMFCSLACQFAYEEEDEEDYETPQT